jgi:hypothetical protein
MLPEELEVLPVVDVNPNQRYIMLMINGIIGGKCAVGPVGIKYVFANCPVCINDIAMAPSSR